MKTFVVVLICIVVCSSGLDGQRRRRSHKSATEQRPRSPEVTNTEVETRKRLAIDLKAEIDARATEKAALVSENKKIRQEAANKVAELNSSIKGLAEEKKGLETVLYYTRLGGAITLGFLGIWVILLKRKVKESAHRQFKDMGYSGNTEFNREQL